MKLTKTKRAYLMRLYEQFRLLARPRTAQALGMLFERLPARVVNALPLIRLFVPGHLWGEVLRLPCNGEVLVYLSPDLERLKQRAVNYVVAHEFAHVVLDTTVPVLSMRTQRHTTMTRGRKS